MELISLKSWKYDLVITVGTILCLSGLYHWGTFGYQSEGDVGLLMLTYFGSLFLLAFLSLNWVASVSVGLLLAVAAGYLGYLRSDHQNSIIVTALAIQSLMIVVIHLPFDLNENNV